MPIPRAAGQRKLGWHLWLLPSPQEGMTKCLIMAHGALTGTFQNAPLDLHFFAPHGRTLVGPNIMELVTKLTYKGAPAAPANDVTTGRAYPDMNLSKVLGRGGEATTYQEIHSVQEAPLSGRVHWEEPHVVVVRHRGMLIGNSIKLSQALVQIQEALPAVTGVWVAACRPHMVSTDKGAVISEFDHVPGRGGRRGVVLGHIRPRRGH